MLMMTPRQLLSQAFDGLHLKVLSLCQLLFIIIPHGFHLSQLSILNLIHLSGMLLHKLSYSFLMSIHYHLHLLSVLPLESLSLLIH